MDFERVFKNSIFSLQNGIKMKDFEESGSNRIMQEYISNLASTYLQNNKHVEYAKILKNWFVFF